MKKLLVIISAFTLTASFAVGQNNATKAEPTKKESATSTSSKCDKKNCCSMKDGKMTTMVDGKEVVMDKEVTMKNGMKCLPDGTCIDKNGKKIKMKNGECCDMNGNVCKTDGQKTTPSKK